MSLNGQQPLITLTIKIDRIDAHRLGIDSKFLTGLTTEIQEKVAGLLYRIYPKARIVDVARSAAHASSFMAHHPDNFKIEAIFWAYEQD